MYIILPYLSFHFFVNHNLFWSLFASVSGFNNSMPDIFPSIMKVEISTIWLSL